MVFTTMNLGIVSTITSWLMNMVVGLILFLLNMILSLFSMAFYMVGAAICSLADFLQAIFRALAGLDTTMTIGDTKIISGTDPIFKMITSEVVINLMISLLVVAIGLLIMCTIIAMIRQEYTAEKANNSKASIVGVALKSLVMFLIVPVVCVMGILLSNVLLRALDYATSNGATSLGAVIFDSSVTDANRVRNEGKAKTVISGGDTFGVIDLGSLFGACIPNKVAADMSSFKDSDYNGASHNLFTSSSANTDENRTATADAIDLAFKKGYSLTGSDTFSTGLFGIMKVNKFDYTSWTCVNAYYYANGINYIVFIGGGFMSLTVLASLAMGMVGRMYKSALLFIVYPPIVAIMPMRQDAFNGWKQSFYKNVISAYAPVVTMNIFFPILDVIGEFKLFSGDGADAYNGIFTTLITIVGLYMLKDFIKDINGFVGGDDAMSAGDKMIGDAKKGVATAASVATGVPTKVLNTVAGVKNTAAKGIAGIAGFAATHGDRKALDAERDNAANAKAVMDDKGNADAAGKLKNYTEAEEKRKVLNNAINSSTDGNVTIDGQTMSKAKANKLLKEQQQIKKDNALTKDEKVKAANYNTAKTQYDDSAAAIATTKATIEKTKGEHNKRAANVADLGLGKLKNKMFGQRKVDPDGEEVSGGGNWLTKVTNNAGQFVGSHGGNALATGLSNNLKAGNKRLAKVMHIDGDGIRAKAAEGKAGLAGTIYAAASGGAMKAASWGRDTRTIANEAQNNLNGMLNDTAVEKMLAEIVKLLKNPETRQQGLAAARDVNKNVGKNAANIDAKKLTVDDLKGGQSFSEIGKDISSGITGALSSGKSLANSGVMKVAPQDVVDLANKIGAEMSKVAEKSTEKAKAAGKSDQQKINDSIAELAKYMKANNEAINKLVDKDKK